jgi:hypothetical protein
MSVRYYRINRAAYTAGELSAITVGPRRLLLPALIARLFVLKLLKWNVPIGDPIADTLLTAPLDSIDLEKIRKRHWVFHEAESALPPLGFTDFRYFRGDDPRSPHDSCGLCGIHDSGSIAVGCTAMTIRKGPTTAYWGEFYSLLADGRTLRSNNHPNAGALRPLPSAIIGRLSDASWQVLFEFHRDRMEQLRSQGSRFVEGMSVDQAIQAHRDYYRDQIAHWVETGLLIPDRGCRAH